MTPKEKYELICTRMKLQDNFSLYEKLYGIKRAEDKKSNNIRWLLDTVIPNLLSDIDTKMDSCMETARIRECETALNKVKAYLDTNGWK